MKSHPVLAFRVAALLFTLIWPAAAWADECISVHSGARLGPHPDFTSWRYGHACYVDWPGGGGQTRIRYQQRCEATPGYVAFHGDFGQNVNTCVFKPATAQPRARSPAGPGSPRRSTGRPPRNSGEYDERACAADKRRQDRLSEELISLGSRRRAARTAAERCTILRRQSRILHEVHREAPAECHTASWRELYEDQELAFRRAAEKECRLAAADGQQGSPAPDRGGRSQKWTDNPRGCITLVQEKKKGWWVGHYENARTCPGLQITVWECNRPLEIGTRTPVCKDATHPLSSGSRWSIYNFEEPGALRRACFQGRCN